MISTGKQLRTAYLEFFRNHPDFPHPVIESSPIVPPDDPTLLFTSAGMVQFKALYSGDVDPLPYPRAASCQKCLRAGGKGSDLENVGKTLRHHTFFEMLGNFSFGDYFKRETVRFAWDFVANHMKLPAERLFPTIYLDDDEAAQIWKEETGCLYEPVRLDEKENFWGPAGDTGACGPCSEVCFFMGTEEELAAIRARYEADPGATLKELAQRIPEEGDLFLEIWNMVFPQFDQQRDGSRPPLKHKGIDTGAGLERMTVALKFARTGQPSTPYETDLMWPIVARASELCGVPYKKLAEPQTDEEAAQRLAINAIADHTRTLVFCLAEGLTPGNVGRRYVIRRIQRRALRFSSMLGVNRPFMADLYDAVVEAMGDAYPEIKKNPEFIRKALRLEEEAFLRTRDRGMKVLNELMAEAEARGDKTIPGKEAFKLWDTFGFPVDLTVEIAEDDGYKVDRAGFDRAMQEKKESEKGFEAAGVGLNPDVVAPLAAQHGQTEFVGYAGTEPAITEIIGLVREGALVERLDEGEKGYVILGSTPFYAESGGQIGDTGEIVAGPSSFAVADTQKTPAGIYIHWGEVTGGALAVGDAAQAAVDAERREAIRRNHSSVHLLQAALKKLVGDHITQAGSYVGPDYSRFDFTQPEALGADQLRAVQEEVNRLILEDTEVSTEVLPLEEAKKKGAIAVFGEKYGATVRVVTMGGGTSIEFCGGTHVGRVGQIARYRIVSEGSISSGVRRIEAVTGQRALQMELEEQYGVVTPLQQLVSAKGPEALERVQTLQDRVKQLEKELAKLKATAATSNLDAHLKDVKDLPGGAKIVAVRLDGLAANELRTVATSLRDKIGPNGVAAVLASTDGKVSIVAAVGKDAQSAFPAGKVVNALAGPLGGKGGGKPDMAQAGAKDDSKLDEVVEKAAELVQ